MQKLYYVEENDLIKFWSSAYRKCFIMSLGYTILRLILTKIGLSFTVMNLVCWPQREARAFKCSAEAVL